MKVDKSMSEYAFQSAVICFAHAYGWRTFHDADSRGNTVGSAGYPDLTMVRGERIIFAELKSERGKLRSAQRQWGRLLQYAETRNEYVEYHIWRPRDWDEITETLARCDP